MISVELMKNYEDTAELFDKYQLKSEPITKAKIEKYMRNNGIEPDTYFQPTDMCYNHTTKPLGKSDDNDFEKTPHIFEYLGYNSYKVLGKNYPYTGIIIRERKKDRKEIVIGEWYNGRLIKWDKSKLLDLYDSESTDLAKYIDEELVSLKLEGEEKKALVKIRINQSIFRDRLLRRYAHCCLCNVSCKKVLRASHIKPWSDCEPEEKLDVNNGFLLCPNHDALFDKGLISFEDNGGILISNELKQVDRVFLNVHDDMKIEVCEQNKKYLDFHRINVFSKE